LKLGIAVSERTVSRAFFANHLSDLALMPVASSVTTSDDVVVDASGLSFRIERFSVVLAAV
jgi:hypothetical protein